MRSLHAAIAVSLSLVSLECIAQDDAVVVTATRFVERLLNAPVGMTVIGAEKIRNSTARSLPQLLAQEAGILARDTTGSPDWQVDLRGFGAAADQNTLVLIDGQRLNEIELVTVRWSAIPLESIERIEILRGSGSVLYGGGATGGTINIITRSPRPQTRSATIRASKGSFGQRELSGSVAAADETLGATLRFDDRAADNYRENNRYEQQNIDGELRINGAMGHIALKFGVENQSLRLPGARTRVQLASDPRGATTPQDFAARDGIRVGLVGNVQLGFAELSADAFLRDSVRTSAQFFFGGQQYLDTRSKVRSFSPRIRIPFEFLGARNSLTIGIDTEDWDYTSIRAVSLEQLDTPTARVLGDQSNRAFYLQNHTQIGDDTKLTIGARQQRVHMSAVDRLNPAAYASGRKVTSPRAWEIGLRHQIRQSSAVYGKVGQSFRISTIDESYSQFGGPVFDAIVALLEPQTSRDHELGYEYRNASSRFRVSTYLNDLRNEIHFFAPTFSNINLPPTRRKGLELDGSMTVSPSLSIFGNLSAVEARFRDGAIGGVNVRGKTIPLVPRETANAGVSWSVTESTKLSASLNHVGKQRFDNDQANAFPGQMPSYETVGLQLSHRIQGVTLRANVTNLFDENYFSYAIRNGAGTSFNAYPQAGRALLFSVELAL